MEESLIRKTVNNNGIEIEYFVSNHVNEKASLILSMGIWEPAFRAFPLITRLAGRHCIALSYRGRGGSSTPKSGFDWQDHSSDLDCVLRNERTNKPVFSGFSKGVSYMLGYLSSNLQTAHGIIIVDFPAIHAKSEKGYAEFWKSRIYNELRLNDYITTHTLEGIEGESTYKEFYHDLSRIECPVLVFRGTDSKSDIPSNLTEDDIQKYKAFVKKIGGYRFSVQRTYDF